MYTNCEMLANQFMIYCVSSFPNEGAAGWLRCNPLWSCWSILFLTLALRCMVASLLTVSLHSDLPYLTQLMEELLQSLMDQPSNAQPKLLLRRTESIVEKLLTNWMSICLYGFLRVSPYIHSHTCWPAVAICLFTLYLPVLLQCLSVWNNTATWYVCSCVIFLGVGWSATLSDGISAKPADL